MAPLNKQPSGLLSFLGIKNGGRNPVELLQDLRGTWDLQQLYLIDNVEAGSSTTVGVGAGALQFGPSATSPRRGPIWVWNYGCRLDASGGAAAGAQLGTVYSPSGIFVPIRDKVIGTSTIVGTGHGGFWLGPDDVLAVQVSDLVGAVDLVAYWRVTIIEAP